MKRKIIIHTGLQSIAERNWGKLCKSLLIIDTVSMKI